MNLTLQKLDITWTTFYEIQVRNQIIVKKHSTKCCLNFKTKRRQHPPNANKSIYLRAGTLLQMTNTRSFVPIGTAPIDHGTCPAITHKNGRSLVLLINRLSILGHTYRNVSSKATIDSGNINSRRDAGSVIVESTNYCFRRLCLPMNSRKYQK